MLVILGLLANVEGAKLLKMLICWDELCIRASGRDLVKVLGTTYCSSLWKEVNN